MDEIKEWKVLKKSAVFGLLLCSAGQALGAENFYTVQEGDAVSAIIQKHLDAHNRSISVFSKDYTAVLEEFVMLNPEIKNLDVIYPGQKIKLPQIQDQPPNEIYTYKIKPGDNLWDLSCKFYPSLKNPFKGIAEIKMLNPQIKSDMIYANKFLTLPTALSNTEIIAERVPAQSASNEALDNEIYRLSKDEAQEYTEIFRKMTQAQSRKELKELCKMTIAIAQMHRHFYLEEAFIELTSMLITSDKEQKDDDKDIDAIKDLFLKWKELRRQKHLSEAR